MSIMLSSPMSSPNWFEKTTLYLKKWWKKSLKEKRTFVGGPLASEPAQDSCISLFGT